METNKMSNLNRIFTRNMLRHFIDGKIDNVYSLVVRRYTSNADQKNNRELISEIYCELKNNYRNEYFYKNTLLNKLLLGVHSVNTTTALTEVAIAKSKADFVLINGKAVVYEIKTELDNLERLSSQIDDYYKAFDHVAVVTYEKNHCTGYGSRNVPVHDGMQRFRIHIRDHQGSRVCGRDNCGRSSREQRGSRQRSGCNR